MTWLTNSKHTSIRSCRTWKSRSPGVETARCTVPASSRNGCSSAGRGPENSRSHASEPIPATQASGASGTRNPTDRCRAAQSASRSLTVSSPPGSMVSTMKIAALVSGASTGCGSGSGSGRATAGTCDHSVTKRPFPADTKLPRGKVSRDRSGQPSRGGPSATPGQRATRVSPSAPLAQPATSAEHDEQGDDGQRVEQPVQRDQAPVGVQPTQGVAAVGDGGHLVLQAVREQQMSSHGSHGAKA